MRNTNIGGDRVRNVHLLLLEPNNINKLLLCSVIPYPFNFSCINIYFLSQLGAES